MSLPSSVCRAAERYALVGIAAIALASFGYCYGYSLLAGGQPNLLQSLVWMLNDWAVWLAVAPLIARAAMAGWTDGMRRAALRIALCLIAALTVRGAIDAFSGELSLALVLYKRIPIYLALACAIALMSLWLGRPRAAAKASPADAEPRLAVQSARGEHVLPVSAVSSIEACGNYLEVRAGGGVYLMRATMKTLEPQLAGTALVRCHRSFFVNLRRVVRLEYRASGNHDLVLSDGATVPVSKGYRESVREALAAFGGGVPAASAASAAPSATPVISFVPATVDSSPAA